VLAGERLALADAGGRAGRYRVRLVALDAATAQAGGWDPNEISQNVRRAVRNPDAVAYLGELDVGSSAISIPILNENGMLQVSPLDTAMGYTVRTAAIAGSPERYYPNLQRAGRTFARLVPSDRVQAAALLGFMEREHIHRLALLDDDDAVELALLDAVRAGARAHGMAIVSDAEVDGTVQDYGELIARVRAGAPDAVLYAGGPLAGGAARLWRQLAAAAPSLRLFAPGSLVDAPFIAAIGPAAASLTYVTRPALSLTAYRSAAHRVVRAAAAGGGGAPAPEALYGYEAMAATLAAIERASDTSGGRLTRAAVVRAFFHAPPRPSVLGTYAVARDGDTSLRRFGAYRVLGGRLRYVGALTG
jgi:branched-chain amino acid transport system substrate-binding protein